MKNSINDFAVNGGRVLFSKKKPTSNLVKPNHDCLKKYIDLYLNKGYDAVINLLEERLASFHDVRHCITFNSGFWALVQNILILADPKKNEVIIPSLTYQRLGDLVSWCGKVPVFCDIDRDSLALSYDTVRAECTINTSLIIGVHPIGGHVDIDGLMSLSEEFMIPIIFDSVESVAEMHNEKVFGSCGSAEIYSLGASKLINGFEGGYATTNSQDLAAKLKENYRDDSSKPVLNIPLPGINAAAALAGLDDVSIHIKRNKSRFDAYKRGFKNIPEVRLKEQCVESRPSYKNIIMELLDEWPLSMGKTIKILNAENVLARAYCPPITDSNLSYHYRKGDLKNTNWARNRFVSMPCGYMVSEEDIEKIVSLLSSIKKHFDAPPHKCGEVKASW